MSANLSSHLSKLIHANLLCLEGKRVKQPMFL